MSAREIAPGVAQVSLGFVNAYLLGDAGGWVLVDSGVPGSSGVIRRAAAERFGDDAKPTAIILTHGHHDHVGGAQSLADGWEVPIYAHPMELPYLTGVSPYPPLDPTVGGGLGQLARAFSAGPFDLDDRIRPLPTNGEVPGLTGWRWLSTPGHSPGHISLFRASDRVLVAGDAVATVDMDSLVAIAKKTQRLSKPPAFGTCDWGMAQRSIRMLAELEPTVLACGHGDPMIGAAVAEAFGRFAETFRPPDHGRYAGRPAVTDENGIVSVPPPVADPLPKVALGIGLAALAGVALARRRRRAPVRPPLPPARRRD